MFVSTHQRLLTTALAGAFGALLITLPSLSLAQGTDAASAQATRIDLPAQPLGAALNALSAQTGVQILASGDMVSGRHAPAVAGQFTAREAADRLLAGSGLRVHSNDRGILVVRAAGETTSAGAGTLPEVRVRADRVGENAFGPVDGYVATRSATGTKTDTPLVETPRSISVVTREQLDVQQPRTASEALRYTPGVVAQSSPLGLNDAGIRIRGFSTTVGQVYYRDGARVSSPAYYGYGGFEPYGLERVEVLRGPASVLYGQNQPGGIVNMVSKRPSSEPVREVQVQAGSYQRAQLALDLGGAITADGQWSYRLVGLQRDSNTQIDNIADNRSYLAPSISWKPSDRTELIVRAEYQRNEGAANNALPASGTVLPNPNGRIPVNRSLGTASDNKESYETRSIGYQLEHRPDDVWTLRQNLRVSRFDADRRTMRNNGFVMDETDPANPVPLDYRTIYRGSWQILADGDTTTLDNQAQARFKTGALEHTALVGVDYHRSAGNLRGGLGGASDLDLYNPVYGVTPTIPRNYDRRSVDEQTGLYLQDQIKIDQRWVVSLGGRQDWSRQVRTNRLATSNGTTVQKDDAFTGQAGLVYLFDNGWAPYASYSQSFVPLAGVTAGGDEFKPEKGVQYEAGVKYAPAGGQTVVTLSVFDLRRKNVLTPDLNDPFESVQTGEVRSRGVELESKSKVASGLDLIGSLSYADVKVTESNNPDELGTRPAGVPKHMASLWLDYAVPAHVVPGLTVGGGARLIGATYGDELNTFRVPGYTLYDVALRYDLGRVSPSMRGLQFALNVQNLTDKRYADCGSADFCEYGTRRTVTATLRYLW